MCLPAHPPPPPPSSAPKHKESSGFATPPTIPTYHPHCLPLLQKIVYRAPPTPPTHPHRPKHGRTVPLPPRNTTYTAPNTPAVHRRHASVLAEESVLLLPQHDHPRHPPPPPPHHMLPYPPPSPPTRAVGAVVLEERKACGRWCDCCGW